MARARALLVLTSFAVACASATSHPNQSDGGPPDAGTSDGGSDDGGSDTDGGTTTLHVLFIGDSYTYVNDLPGMLRQLAATSGVAPAIETDEVVQGGATLEAQWDNGAAQTKILGQQWTHVVVQGQSQEPLNAFGDQADFFAYAEMFGDLIVDAGARPTLFATWARAAGDPSYAPPNALFVSPAEMQDELTMAYAKVARLYPTSVLVCVGEAFKRAIAQYPEIALQQTDFSHPTVAGTYLAASTFYVALTGQPAPSASTLPAGLSADDAASLRGIAQVGTDCADVRVAGVINTSLGEYQDGGLFFDFGTSGLPLPADIELTNSGGTAVGISDGLALAPPFEWTAGGAYPGGTGTSADLGVSYCGSTLDAGDSCALSVTYTAATSASGRLTLDITGAYLPTVTGALTGTTTSRSLLTVSDTPGFFACTDACGPLGVAARPRATNIFNLFVLNRGAVMATGIAVGIPLSAPFAWTAGGFPGGEGSVTVGAPAGTIPYCATTLAPQEQCAVSVTFSAPSDAGDAGPYTSAVNLSYSDAMGSVSPNANRDLEGQVSTLPP